MLRTKSKHMWLPWADNLMNKTTQSWFPVSSFHLRDLTWHKLVLLQFLKKRIKYFFCILSGFQNPVKFDSSLRWTIFCQIVSINIHWYNGKNEFTNKTAGYHQHILSLPIFVKKVFKKLKTFFCRINTFYIIFSNFFNFQIFSDFF